MDPRHLWVAVIAGGQGTRLFPISHPDCPKQFCQLDDKNTFIQKTIENFKAIGIKPTQIIITVTSPGQKALAMEQCLPRGILSQNIIQLDPKLGYPVNMIRAAEFVRDIDPDGIVINTPSDQYISGEGFADTIETAVTGASQGDAVIVGVKIGDIVTAMGCGHAIYDKEDGFYHTVNSFVEKPERHIADAIMRSGNSACNTGINVWPAKLICEKFHPHEAYAGISTDAFMAKIGNLKIAVGTFRWYDCGTLDSLYAISAKTPNHKNASLGGGIIERSDCRRSLFYASEGMELHASGCEDDAVVFTVIGEHPIIVIAKRAESQKIKLLAEDYLKHQDILTEDFSMGARNNIVLHSNISKELIAGFVGVKNYVVYVERRADDRLVAIVSQPIDRTV